MRERRSLVDGVVPLNNVDRAVEDQFVHAGQTTTANPVAADEAERLPQPPAASRRQANAMSRMPLTTRIRTDYATALKRASLERQLSGTVPNTLQDILEEALEPWLRSNGYLN